MGGEGGIVSLGTPCGATGEEDVAHLLGIGLRLGWWRLGRVRVRVRVRVGVRVFVTVADPLGSHTQWG